MTRVENARTTEKGADVRRLIHRVVIALVVLGTVPGVAGATHSNGQGPGHDFVVGTVKFSGMSPEGNQVTAERHVNAKSGPSGQEAEGYFWIRQESPRGNLDFSGRVTCLSINGNRAVVGGEVERGKLLPPGRGVLIEYVDRGEGAGEGPDLSRPTGRPEPPTSCPAALDIAQPITSGNITVHDATP
jgi:hypothetical protein